MLSLEFVTICGDRKPVGDGGLEWWTAGVGLRVGVRAVDVPHCAGSSFG